MGALGERFARAIAARDADALKAILAPDVDFRGLTPHEFWEASDRDDLVDRVLLGSWFEPTDVVTSIERLDAGAVGARHGVTYRFRVDTAEGERVTEQQAYYETDGGRMTYLRVMCSGFLPDPG